MSIKVLEKLGKRITSNKVTIVLGIVFILSLIPIIYLSFFNYATGDDLWEGAVAHYVLWRGGDFGTFIKAICEQFISDYMGWEGNWSSIILWCLEPSIWGERVYIITTYIALIAICGSSWYFVKYFVKTYFSDSKCMGWLAFFAINIMMIQYAPNLKNAFFWYTGMVNYMVPFGCLLLVIVWCDKYLLLQKSRYIVFMSITMLYMSGAGYPAIVMVFLSVCVECLFHLLILRNKHSDSYKKYLKLIIPIVFLLVGFAVSALSPGNAKRGGDTYYFSIKRVLDTLVSCFKYGAVYSFDYIAHNRLWLIIYPLVGCLIYEKIDISKYSFRLPGLITGSLVCIWCSGFAPEIYSMDGVSGGVPNTYYFTFVLATFFIMIYWIGWIKVKYSKDELPAIKTVILIISFLMIAVFASHFYSQTSMHDCLDYITSGQLEDYNRQMLERITILEDDSIKDVVLPEINEYQGPFMHMAITDNPDSYTNQCVRRFYLKNTVVAVSRDEWEMMH